MPSSRNAMQTLPTEALQERFTRGCAFQLTVYSLREIGLSSGAEGSQANFHYEGDGRG
jgi:hypothetical protein